MPLDLGIAIAMFGFRVSVSGLPETEPVGSVAGGYKEGK